jgi:hypothetical protein
MNLLNGVLVVGTLIALANFATSLPAVATEASDIPQVTFTASPTHVQPGGTAVLTWKSSNAYECHGYGPWDSFEPLEGSSTTDGLTATTTFVLTCFNANGPKTSKKATITVVDPTATGTATLSWDAPAVNTNGTPVTPLAGYTIYYGTAEGSMSKSLVVNGASTTSAEVTGLAAGTWYFGIEANASDGTHSALSEIGSISL